MKKDTPILRRLLLLGAAATAGTLLAGCASETIFQSSFNTQSPGAVPSAAQATGTAQVSGDPGSVVIAGPVPGSNENWVRISRANAQQSQVSTFQGTLSKTPGLGNYSFLGVLFIPSGSGLASVEFDTGAFGSPASTSFLHLDFTQENRVRINDTNDADHIWGSFPRDQFFTLSVNLEITTTSAVAHMTLLGTGTSGNKDFTIPSPFNNFSQQFGQIRVFMGFPWTGSFDATDLLVTHRK
jgi:hypothetical protein